MGRCRADDASVPTQRLFVGDLPAGREQRLRARAARARRRPASDHRGPARAAVLRQAVGNDVELSVGAGIHLEHDFFGRRDHRRDDYHVRGGGQSHRRNRHPARARFSALQYPDGVPYRVAALESGRRRGRSWPCVFSAALHGLDHELADLRRACLHLQHEYPGGRRGPVIRAVHGVGRWLPAGHPRGAAGYC